MKYNFIDLFAGCGGLSEGFYKEKFNALAHVEIDKYACQTLKRRMQYYNYKNAGLESLHASILEGSTFEQVYTIILLIIFIPLIILGIIYAVIKKKKQRI